MKPWLKYMEDFVAEGIVADIIRDISFDINKPWISSERITVVVASNSQSTFQYAHIRPYRKEKKGEVYWLITLFPIFFRQRPYTRLEILVHEISHINDNKTAVISKHGETFYRTVIARMENLLDDAYAFGLAERCSQLSLESLHIEFPYKLYRLIGDAAAMKKSIQEIEAKAESLK